MKTVGIDLGTTKVAVVVYDSRNGLEEAVSAAHHAARKCGDPRAFEQDPEKILNCVTELLARLPAPQRSAAAAVGITGQMHSLLLRDGKRVSELITWQDHRCGAEAVAEGRTITVNHAQIVRKGLLIYSTTINREINNQLLQITSGSKTRLKI